MLKRILPGSRSDGPERRSALESALLDLEPGEWAEVRPIGEINETLDEQRRYGGLYFMPEMEQFCGQRFRVLKRVRTVRLESTGEIRRLRGPTVLLEGVYCTGDQHEGCDRACLHLWREAWLERVPAAETRTPSAAAGDT